MDLLITPQFNAITFSLFGMSIVFTGLALIAIYIKFLPLFLNTLELTKRVRRRDRGELSDEEREEEEIAAIMVAFRLHNMSELDDQRVTWARHQGPKSTWDISRRADL